LCFRSDSGGKGSLKSQKGKEELRSFVMTGKKEKNQGDRGRKACGIAPGVGGSGRIKLRKKKQKKNGEDLDRNGYERAVTGKEG